MTVARGVEAHQADATDLLFGDDTFDVVTAMWMLHHLTDLRRGLAEVARVLRTRGLFVAVTNGDTHLADLLTAAGGSAALTQFSSENGAARGYLSTYDTALAAGLPWFDGSQEYAAATTVFLAR